MEADNTKIPIEVWDVQLYDGGKLSAITDRIIREVPVELYLNGDKVITIACAGIHLEELAAGFLKSEGIIRSRQDLYGITVSHGGSQIHASTIDRKQLLHDRSILSSGARETGSEQMGKTITSDMKVSVTNALRLMDDHLNATVIHKATHGTHCSSLADGEGRLIVSREDIGRHNTLDMIGGYILLNAVDCSKKIIATTGRVSSEIASKVWKLGIPVILSHAVPTSQAIMMGNEAGITIIGYMRNGKMTVYSHRERVIF
ncbi:MAG: formate dehydrogenase accessory sulfurtransferase FdhD [Deltaproteobacteria bacterium]|nr:formate dehydrogenase accessory sulfurtransferase FdhD [Deltaproteobacteria bacterium]